MVTKNVVRCERKTADRIYEILRSESYNKNVPLEARKTASFPEKWTEETAVEFTRALRACDQRVMEHILCHDVHISESLNLLEMLGDLRLPQSWLDTRQTCYEFLQKCLDLGQPVHPRAIPRFDWGHYAIIKLHPSTTKATKDTLSRMGFELAKLEDDRSRNNRLVISSLLAVVIALVLGFALLLALHLQSLPKTRPCPEAPTCPGLEDYAFDPLVLAASRKANFGQRLLGAIFFIYTLFASILGI